MKTKLPSNQRRLSQKIIAATGQTQFRCNFEVSGHFIVTIDGSNNTHLFEKPVDYANLGRNNVLLWKGQPLQGEETVIIYDYD